MQHAIIPPYEAKPHEPIRPPMIYVERQLKWEYKQIVRNLESEKTLDEAEMNALGEDGWEMTGIAQHPPMTYYYFKRPTEK
ncbi:MAG: hypothetical protein ABI621_04840 [Chloroflexota bacterium]